MGLNSDLLNFIYALLLGGIFLSIYTGILAYIGGRTAQIGWFGVCSAMLAIPVAEHLGCSVYPVLAFACMFMIYTAYVGFKGLEILSYIAVPMILVLGGWSYGRRSAPEVRVLSRPSTPPPVRMILT